MRNQHGRAIGARVVLAAALVSCSPFTSSAQPSPTPTPPSPAQSQAADLRTHLDLLLGEHVFIVAKESEAAVNHAGEYTSYTSLLVINATDVAGVVERAFGTTAATEYSRAWTAQDGFLADYAIGVVTHNQDKAIAAQSNLAGASVPHIAQLMAGLLHIKADQVAALLNSQLAAIKGFIDGDFAQNYSLAYSQLHSAYTRAAALGDLLASKIAQDFPDKFPGDPSADVVNRRASTNNLLQERAYLSTMATDAVVNGRVGENVSALAAVAANSTSIDSVLKNPQLKAAWALEIPALNSYAADGDAAASNALTQTFPSQLSGLTGTPVTLISDQASATIKVIDDQRGKASQSLAGDDRAAATAMQPLADALAA